MDQTLYNLTLFAGVAHDDNDNDNNKDDNNNDDNNNDDNNNEDDKQTPVNQVDDEMHPDDMEQGFERQHTDKSSIKSVKTRLQICDNAPKSPSNSINLIATIFIGQRQGHREYNHHDKLPIFPDLQSDERHQGIWRKGSPSCPQ
jgi:hypothetical protein